MNKSDVYIHINSIVFNTHNANRLLCFVHYDIEKLNYPTVEFYVQFNSINNIYFHMNTIVHSSSFGILCSRTIWFVYTGL